MADSPCGLVPRAELTPTGRWHVVSLAPSSRFFDRQSLLFLIATFDDVLTRIQVHDVDGLPVSSVSTPAFRVFLLRCFVDFNSLA